MEKIEIQEIESFASLVLRRYFCGAKVDSLLSALAPDIVWLGAGENQKAQGIEEVSRCFRQGEKDLAPCKMYDETYVTLPLGEGYYLCQGESWIEAENETEMHLKVIQRITFIFRRKPDRSLEIVHIHNSVPFSAIQEDELFPAQKAKEDYQRLQNDLVQKDQQIELMLSHLPGGMQVCYCDDNFTTKWVSLGFCQMLGYSSMEEYAQKTGNSCEGMILPEDYYPMRELVRESLKKGDSYSVEYRALRKDGSVFWVLDMGKRGVDLDGEEVISCFISDITQRKQQETYVEKAHIEMKRQADFLTQLYNTVPCAILQFSTDSSHRILHANRMVWEIYGYQEKEFWERVQTPFQFVMDRDREMIQSRLDELKLNGKTISYTRETWRLDGSECWISVNMGRLVNTNGIEVFQAVFTDVTETKKLQMQWEKEKILENRSLRAAICTAYPLIINVNLTLNSYHCFLEESSIGLPDEKQKGSYDSLYRMSWENSHPSYQKEYKDKFSRETVLELFQKQEREIYMELQQKGEDGIYHWVSVHMIRVENPYSSQRLAIILIKLLDDQRAEKARQEQLLREALSSAKAANHAKSDFLSRMSHDIRTPMNAIIGMSAIGQLKLQDMTRVKDCFQKIDASSRYLLSLINDILDMSKIESGKMTISQMRFDFTQFINEISSIIYPQAYSKDVQFEVQHREPLEQFYIGDSLRLNQILMNLLSNALKFTPAGGKISIGIQEIKRSNGFAYLEFMVSDTGCGMSRGFMEKLYQPFEQETPGTARNNIGSGLGLSIVYSLVQLMGGTIEVQSEKERGTSFAVNLPLKLLDHDEAKERDRKSRELLKGLRVLVADDDSIVGEQTSEILSNIGACSTWVDSGVKAVREVERALEDGNLFDIAMIDWQMPDMDGLETTRRIRKLTGPDTMIIIISAYDWSDIEQEAKEAGASCFIPKPLFQSTVYQTLLNLNLVPHEPKARPVYHFKGRRILLVEDNELNMEIAKSLLEFEGILVDTAENGEIAVEKYRSSREGEYLAILMDIRMPVMDGLEATRIIRSMGRGDSASIPIIAMTANAFEEDRNIAMEAGMNRYLVKPINIDLLFQELEHSVFE